MNQDLLCERAKSLSLGACAIRFHMGEASVVGRHGISHGKRKSLLHHCVGGLAAKAALAVASVQIAA